MTGLPDEIEGIIISKLDGRTITKLLSVSRSLHHKIELYCRDRFLSKYRLVPSDIKAVSYKRFNQWNLLYKYTTFDRVPSIVGGLIMCMDDRHIPLLELMIENKSLYPMYTYISFASCTTYFDDRFLYCDTDINNRNVLRMMFESGILPIGKALEPSKVAFSTVCLSDEKYEFLLSLSLVRDETEKHIHHSMLETMIKLSDTHLVPYQKSIDRICSLSRDAGKKCLSWLLGKNLGIDIDSVLWTVDDVHTIITAPNINDSIIPNIATYMKLKNVNISSISHSSQTLSFFKIMRQLLITPPIASDDDVCLVILRCIETYILSKDANFIVIVDSILTSCDRQFNSLHLEKISQLVMSKKMTSTLELLSKCNNFIITDDMYQYPWMQDIMMYTYS